MKLLIKLGGTLLDSADSRSRLAAEIASAAQHHPTVVVHGGGKQMTRFLSERGVESRFVNGLRVSTPEVIDALLKVLSGTVNAELVSSLLASGARAVGLSGLDGGIIQAEQLSAELGFVGKPTRSNGALLDLLASGGYLPVIACVGGDSQGNIYNVNADQAAVACASGFAASSLIFLTDVDGVRGADGKILPILTPAAARKLIEEGVASGGMQAKLEAALTALNAGCGQIVIAPGARAGAVASILNGESIGTRLVSKESQ
jgi:acetylglutamate kinase